MLLSERQLSDYEGAALMIDACSTAGGLLGDKNYEAMVPRRIRRTQDHPIKGKSKVPIPHDAALYRQRRIIENIFGKLRDWRRIHTRYDRCAHTQLSAICFVATVIFSLNQLVLSLTPS